MMGPMRRRFLLALLLVAAASTITAGAAGAAAKPLPGLQTSKAPWGPNNQAPLAARLGVLGLPALSAEGAALHVHQHLDLFVHGKAVPVAPGIGIDAGARFIAELHTHDISGIVHIEAPRIQPFTLGQFFDVWGLRFTQTCLGAYCAGNGSRLWIWVNGQRALSDPRNIILKSHLEIVVAFGTRAELPRPIAKAYPFPAGF